MLTTIAKPWLAMQCQMIPGARRAIVSLEPGAQEKLKPTACWPEETAVTDALRVVGQLAVTRGSTVIQPVSQDGGTGAVLLAWPMLSGRRIFGVLAIELEQLEVSQQAAVMQLLTWGSTLLEVMIQQSTGAAVAARLAAVVETAMKALEQSTFEKGATAALSHLATALDCERVSVGYLHRGHMRVEALSHSARISRRSTLLMNVQAAMDEAHDSGGVIVHSAIDTRPLLVHDAHARLARRQDDIAVCTVPLTDTRATVGAMTFERTTGSTFDRSSVELMEAIAALLGPVLTLERQRDRSMTARLSQAGGRFAARLLGHGYLRTKLAALALVGGIAYLSFATGDYRVSSPATLEGTVHRALVAPIDGYIETAEARAGEVVESGQRLATLDSETLALELGKLAAERNELRNEHRRSLAGRKRAEAKVLEAQIARVSAQIALVEQQLERTEVRAPFDGVVLSGDLSQSLGAPVERGQVLFEVAPLDGYRMVLDVDENDVSDVKPGQRGTLVLAALPNQKFPFQVEQVVGIASNESGSTAFRVEASVESESGELRPGMQGVGKISVEPRRLLWVWTHGLYERVVLWLWAHVP